MNDQQWAFPSLQRDLTVIGAGIVVAAGLVGAAIGIGVDVLVRRHRAV